MNKSRVARDLWRKVFNDNLINLSDGDARKGVVRDFLNDPINKKAGWKSKDARFFRLGFQKVAKENNFNVMSIGVSPTPSRSKTQKGTTKFNVKSQIKNPPPLQEVPTTDQIKKDGKTPMPIPNTPIIQAQVDQASYYSAQSVGQICETVLNIIFTRLGVSSITQNERIALGEGWSPLANKYLTGHSELIMPILITLPIIFGRLAEVARMKKEKELKEKYGLKDQQPHEEEKKRSNWSDLSFGEKTNER